MKIAKFGHFGLKCDVIEWTTHAKSMLMYVCDTRAALETCGCSPELAQEIIDMMCHEFNVIDFYNIVKSAPCIEFLKISDDDEDLISEEYSE